MTRYCINRLEESQILFTENEQEEDILDELIRLYSQKTKLTRKDISSIANKIRLLQFLKYKFSQHSLYQDNLDNVDENALKQKIIHKTQNYKPLLTKYLNDNYDNKYLIPIVHSMNRFYENDVDSKGGISNEIINQIETIEKIHRAKQDSLYVLSSIRLDEALRGRIESEENTKKELLDLIKLQIQGENTGNLDLSSNTEAGLYGKRPSSSRGGLTGQTWLMILLILILLTILLILIMKNRAPVYLKPKTPDNGSTPPGNITSDTPMPTQAHTDDEVVRSELQSLRQSAVSMSVSEKTGANQIVKDWLDDKTDENDDEQNNKEE